LHEQSEVIGAEGGESKKNKNGEATPQSRPKNGMQWDLEHFTHLGESGRTGHLIIEQ
jgi:hypothetical protein